MIVNVSSVVAEFGMTGMGLYGSSKAALELLTKSWAAEFGPRGVRVNAVSPGPTRTPGTAVLGEGLDQLAAAGPAGRPGSPEEIADAIAYLATDRSSFVHGAVLPVDGAASRSEPRSGCPARRALDPRRVRVDADPAPASRLSCKLRFRIQFRLLVGIRSDARPPGVGHRRRVRGS